MELIEKAINAICYSYCNTAYLLFDGRAAFRAVVDGKIRGFRPSPKIVDPKSFETGAMFNIVPDVETKNVTEWETWMRQHPELIEQFRPFFKPENRDLAAGWASVLSQ